MNIKNFGAWVISVSTSTTPLLGVAAVLLIFCGGLFLKLKSLNKARNILSSALQRENAELEQLSNRHSQLISERLQIEAKNSELEDALKSQINEVDRLSKAYLESTTRATNSDIKLEATTQRIAQLEAACAKTTRLDQISNKYRQLVAERDQLRAKISRLEDELQAQKSLVNRLLSKSPIDSTNQASNSDVELEVASAKTVKLNEISNKYRQLAAERDQLRAKISELENALQGEKAEVIRISGSYIESTAQAKNSDIELEAATLRIAQLEDVCAKTLTEKNVLLQRNAELEQQALMVESIENLKSTLQNFEDENEIIASGLYPLSLEPETPDELKAQLDAKRIELAAMVRDRTAAICTTKWTIDGSTAEGTKATKNYIRIMLRTFNADADACLDNIRWNNLDKCIARLISSFEYVNKLGTTHSTTIQASYLELRISQIKLMHRYREVLCREKEAMRAERIAEKEERQAQRELERARFEAEQEELRYQRALENARVELNSLGGDEHTKMLLRISKLEQQLAKASELKARAISMAQITKAGFVYVVSNIGSFGPDVLKIGMTRRIDPLDRIRELGGASVPFPFDVHAMIYSVDAPGLENLFHRNFSRQRINLANGRKEFFRIALLDVINYAKTLSLQAEFTSETEAKDFKLSAELRRDVLNSLSDEELQQRLNVMTTQGAADYEEEEEDRIDT